MLRDVLGVIVGLLSFAGGTALLLLLIRGALRYALDSAEVIASAGLAEVSARRGDLTGMTERRSAEQAARRARQGTLLLALLWLTWLTAPLLLGWAREAYAAAAPLWMLRPAARRRTPASAPSTPP